MLNEIERLMFMWASFFLLFLAVINFLAPDGMIGYSTRFRNVKLEILICHIKKRTKNCHYSLLNKIKCVFFYDMDFEFWFGTQEHGVYFLFVVFVPFWACLYSYNTMHNRGTVYVMFGCQKNKKS